MSFEICSCDAWVTVAVITSYHEEEGVAAMTDAENMKT